MAWNQSTTNSENQNTESKVLKKPEYKRPKCVSFAFWWFVVLGILVPVLSFMPGAMAVAPWTEYVGICLVGILMLDCARMVSKRNMTAVSITTLALFISAWILTDRDFAIGLALPPMIFLVLPHSIRWLKLNNRFSVPVLIASIVMVSFSCQLCFTPIVTHTVISNKNPLCVVVPGDKSPHKLNEIYQHEYMYRQQCRGVGKFVAQYNQDGECCYVRLDGYGPLFWENVIDMCNVRFYNKILWSNVVTDKGRKTEEDFPILCGTVDKKIIMIFPGPVVEGADFGTLLVCDSQLNSELDFLFSLPEENAEIALLDAFLEIRDSILSVERDVDDAQRSNRNKICEGLKELRDRANMLEKLSSGIAFQMGEVEDPRVAKIIEDFALRRKTMCELAKIIGTTAHMAVTAIEYNTEALPMRRGERIKLRRQYLERGAPVPDELLPIDPTDHSGQNKVFDWAAKQFKEGREELYWELHEKTGYSLGRPYNPKFKNGSRRQSSAAPDQSAHEKNGFSGQSKTPTPSIHNDPSNGMYGSKERAKLFSSSFRNGLGMY